MRQQAQSDFRNFKLTVPPFFKQSEYYTPKQGGFHARDATQRILTVMSETKTKVISQQDTLKIFIQSRNKRWRHFRKVVLDLVGQKQRNVRSPHSCTFHCYLWIKPVDRWVVRLSAHTGWPTRELHVVLKQFSRHCYTDAMIIWGCVGIALTWASFLPPHWFLNMHQRDNFCERLCAPAS